VGEANAQNDRLIFAQGLRGIRAIKLWFNQNNFPALDGLDWGGGHR
jgi:hypothetical protein